MADASSNTDATERDNWIPNLAGKRRWWPVRCTAIDLDALRSDQPQLWAEALVRYGSGERWWLHEDSLVQAAAAEQDALRWTPIVRQSEPLVKV